MIRTLVAVLVGVVVGGLLVAAPLALSMLVFRPPPTLDPELVPIGALLLSLASWALGAFAGGWAAAHITRPRDPSVVKPPRLASLVVGSALMISSLITMIQVPHPFWFWIPGLLLPIPCSLFGARVARPRAM